MRTWFIRCNGETAHNEPGTSRFVPGEPPRHPDREFNYVKECLRDGFARVGWPGAGDLRLPGWRTQAQKTYPDLIEARHFRYLEQFREIRVGDAAVMPTYHRKYEVYLGQVVAPRDAAQRRGASAYYYFHDVKAGHWFDNAHRVDVDWVRSPPGDWRAFEISEVGGLWLRGFGEVGNAAARVHALLRESTR